MDRQVRICDIMNSQAVLKTHDLKSKPSQVEDWMDVFHARVGGGLPVKLNWAYWHGHTGKA